MSKKNKKVANATLFAMITEMWADVCAGKVDAESINLTGYCKKFHVGKFKRSMVLPYIMQKRCPTYEQACELRKEISNNMNDSHKQQPKRTDITEPSLFGQDTHIKPKEVIIGECIEFLEPKKIVISECIEILKKEGYVIFKKM